MATLKTNTLTGTTTAGSIAVTGEGNSTTTNLQQGLCKAWINLNGSGTIATRDSFNIATITDNGTGDYAWTITNDLANANYAGVAVGTEFAANSGSAPDIINVKNIAAGGFAAEAHEADNNNYDMVLLIATAHGDLA